MPNIHEFNTPALNIRPTETGVNAVAAAARRVGSEYNEAGSAIAAGGAAVGQATRVAGEIYDDQVTHEEISRGGAALAGMMGKKTDDWNNTVKGADPNNPTAAAKFMEENLEPDLEKFKEGFTTTRSQQWADNHLNSFRLHMQTKTAADMATMAGEAIKVNYRQTTNSMANTARNDPTAVDFLLKTYEDTLDATVGSSPNLKGAMAGAVRTELLQRGKEEIIKAAALGHIEATGSMPKWSTDPKYSPYITGGELKQLEAAEKNYRRLNTAEERAARAEEKFVAVDDFNKRVNELEASTIPKNVGDPPQLPPNYWNDTRELAKHPGAAYVPGRLKTTIDNGERITARLEKGEPLGPISHETTVGLLRSMRSEGPDRMKNDQPIFEAFYAGQLKNADFNFLRSEWANWKSPNGDPLGRERGEFFKRYEGFMDEKATLGVRTPEGQARLYQAEMAARRAEEELKRTGKDPHSLYDADSDNFFGRSGNMLKYVPPTLQQKLRSTLPPVPTFNERFQSKEIGAATPPLITSKDDYDKLAPGAMFYGSAGRAYIKPKK